MSDESKGKLPAFPSFGVGSYSGMTLRDWFASQALASMKEGDYSSWERRAEASYLCADAMLKERDKPQ